MVGGCRSKLFAKRSFCEVATASICCGELGESWTMRAVVFRNNVQDVLRKVVVDVGESSTSTAPLDCKAKRGGIIPLVFTARCRLSSTS